MCVTCTCSELPQHMPLTPFLFSLLHGSPAGGLKLPPCQYALPGFRKLWGMRERPVCNSTTGGREREKERFLGETFVLMKMSFPAGVQRTSEPCLSRTAFLIPSIVGGTIGFRGEHRTHLHIFTLNPIESRKATFLLLSPFNC